MQIIEADLTWTDGAFQPGVQVAIDQRGVISEVGSLRRAPTRRLTGCALLPGLINAHSHAFQRGLRGAGENYPCDAGDFWSWREEMYDLVQRLDRDRFLGLCTRAFSEMRAGGVTTVVEFHYLHHDDADRADFAFDELLCEAAQAVGVRLVLLCTYYAAGGFGAPLSGGQRRFATSSYERFWKHVDALRERTTGSTVSIGVAAHSIRAVPTDILPLLHADARQRGMPFHMHLEEQPRELADCEQALGARPLRWTLDQLDVGPEFTAIHLTHTREAELRELLQRGGNVCICPITEANLGDGLSRADVMFERPDAVCLGSDSNVRIDLWEEARWLELGQRLRTGRRGVLRDDAGEVGPRLLGSLTVNAARAAGVGVGAIRRTQAADLVAVDLTHPHLSGLTPAQLSAGLVLGAGAEVVATTCVAGVWSA